MRSILNVLWDFGLKMQFQSWSFIVNSFQPIEVCRNKKFCISVLLAIKYPSFQIKIFATFASNYHDKCYVQLEETFTFFIPVSSFDKT